MSKRGKFQSLILLSLAEVLALSVWLSASAVVRQLEDAWSLNSGQVAWLTMSVQAGFVAGSLLSAILNLPDRFSSRNVLAAGALAAAVCNSGVVFAGGYSGALIARFATGMALAAVYPPGMKVVATWTKQDRGLGIGVLVGAVTLGSAMPHLVGAFQFSGQAETLGWSETVIFTSLLSAAAAGVTLLGVKEGPYLSKQAPFNWKYVGTVLSYRPTRLANFGYLGHMWELYAMWVWVPVLLLEVFEVAGWSATAARLMGFGVIGIGAVGSVWAGALADRLGRTKITVVSLAISGSCSLLVGGFLDYPTVVSAVCLIWGFAVVADSAQFSSAVTELADERYVGTALTVQTALGFLLTLVSIRLVPPLVDVLGWRWAFIALAAGPVFGIWSMLALRRLPESARMALGNR